MTRSTPRAVIVSSEMGTDAGLDTLLGDTLLFVADAGNANLSAQPIDKTITSSRRRVRQPAPLPVRRTKRSGPGRMNRPGAGSPAREPAPLWQRPLVWLGIREKPPFEDESWLTKVVEMIREYDNLWTDISYTLFADDDNVYLLKVLLQEPRIRRRVLFGSDFYVVQNARLEERSRSVRIRAILGGRALPRDRRAESARLLEPEPRQTSARHRIGSAGHPALRCAFGHQARETRGTRGVSWGSLTNVSDLPPEGRRLKSPRPEAARRRGALSSSTGTTPSTRRRRPLPTRISSSARTSTV